MPRDIPTDIADTLTAKGIVSPATARWKRLDEWPLRRIRAHCYCDCTAGGRIEMRAMRLGERGVFLGQCGGCRTIYWRDAVRE